MRNRWVMIAGLLVVLAGTGTAQIRTSKIEADFHGGTITALTNRITGEVIAPPTQSTVSASLLRFGMKDLPANAQSHSPHLKGELTATWHGDAGEQATSQLSTEPTSGDITLKQSGSAPGKHVRGISWRLQDVPDSLDVIVPGNSGQRLDHQSPMDRRVFDYPLSWEVQFVLLQGKLGGVLIYSQDQNFQFKSIIVEHVPGKFHLIFISYANAPFATCVRIDAPTWRLHAYSGAWQAGVKAYQSWAVHRFPAAFPAIPQPAWTSDIHFVVLVGNDASVLAPLAKEVDPKQTLLYNPSWRKNEYDRMYPDYEAAPEFPAFMQEAHRLGFRVMVHVNHFGCDPKSPLFDSFKGHQMRDADSGDLLWWDWKLATPPIKFAYINTAYPPWRQLFIDRMKQVREKFGVDAIHLDQTLCMYNDQNGPIDGVNSMQGNLTLHRELRESLPELALSGEGLDEITARYEAFAQRHISGVDFVNGTWDDALLRQSHPVSSMVLLPQTAIYGYLGMANPVQSPGTYFACRRAYENFGVLPTYAWPDAAQLSGDNSVIRQLLTEAKVWTTSMPRPDFDTPWKSDELFVYRTADGNRLSYVRDNGVALRLEGANGEAKVFTRRIEGVREAAVPGSLTNWPVYDANRILGLDPSASYAWSSEPRDLTQLHVETLPAGFALIRAGRHADMARFAFFPEPPERRADMIKLWQFNGNTRSGVRLKDGTTRSYQSAGFLDEESNGNAHVMGEGVFIHPPWKGPNLPGASFVEYKLHVPTGPRVMFACKIHLNVGAEGKSDGVVFRITAATEDRTLSASKLYAGEAQKPLELDLTPISGKDVTLTLTADTAPTGNPGFDWSLFERPSIYVEHESEPGKVVVAGLGAADHVLTTAAPFTGAIREGKATVDVVAPGQILVMKQPPLNVDTLPADLLKLPFTVHSATLDGIETGQPQYPTVVGDALCLGQSMPALNEHPPNFGRTFVDYWLHLPNSPIKFVSSCGLRDGSRSTGAAFELEVNGKRLLRYETMPGREWHPISVDLAEYAGRDVLLTLITDSMGEFSFDWTVWGNPKLRSAGK